MGLEHAFPKPGLKADKCQRSGSFAFTVTFGTTLRKHQVIEASLSKIGLGRGAAELQLNDTPRVRVGEAYERVGYSGQEDGIGPTRVAELECERVRWGDVRRLFGRLHEPVAQCRDRLPESQHLGGRAVQVRLVAAKTGTDKTIVDMLEDTSSLSISLQIAFNERGFQILLRIGANKICEDLMEKPPKQHSRWGSIAR